MAEPKKRLTSNRSGKRRMHLKLKTKKLVECPKCKSLLIPHRACKNCGYYRNQDVLKLEVKAKAKEERRKAREEEEKAAEKEAAPKPESKKEKSKEK